jgi:hypothetical protein
MVYLNIATGYMVSVLHPWSFLSKETPYKLAPKTGHFKNVHFGYSAGDFWNNMQKHVCD